MVPCRHGCKLGRAARAYRLRFFSFRALLAQHTEPLSIVMEKQMVDPQYATGAIKKQLAGVIDHLSGRKGDLSAQSAKYDELAHQLGGKAGGDKVMVLLGDGYFVEHTVEDARLFLQRRITHIGQAVAEIEARIKETRETVTRFEAFARHEEFSMEDGISNVASEQKKSLNEEGLPFIEIREELDEEGNVVEAKVDGVAQLPPEALASSYVERVAEGEAPENLTGIMNIVETIDDDDNVVGAVVKPEEARSSAETKVEEVEPHTPASPTHDHVRDLLEEMEVAARPTVNENELLERIDKLEVSTDDKFRLKAIVLEEYRKAPESHDKGLDAPAKAPAAAIDPSELIELEILADDFDDDNVGHEFADDEEWDFEFSDDADDDDDDDDGADELLYGAKKPDFIANNGLNNRLWQEVMALRGDGPPVPKGPTKSVRFAAQLDIKEVENVGQELKNIQHVNQNVSRFMQSRAGHPKIEAVGEEAGSQPVEVITDKATVEDPPMTDASRAKRKSRFKSMREEKGTAAKAVTSPLAVAPRETEEAPLNDVVERQVVDQPQMQSPMIDEETQTEDAESSSGVLSDVVESVAAPLAPPQAPTGRKPSKFRMQRDKSQTAFRSVTPKPVPIDSDKPLDRRAEIEQSISEIEDEVVPAEERSVLAEGEITAVEATMDYQSMQNDMDTMARAYVLGMYDDDIVTEGPVVDKLEDFEIINKIVEDKAAGGDATMTATKEDEEEEDEEDDGDILQDVIERDTSLDPTEDAEDTILAHEVQTNYHRLRRQLMQAREAGYRKTDAEMEFEPIDEFGNPVKISRFRSARLN